MAANTSKWFDSWRKGRVPIASAAAGNSTARGRFHYFRDGAPVAIREDWQCISAQPSRWRATRDASASFGVELAVAATGPSPHRPVTWFSIAMRRPGEAACAHAEFALTDRGLRVRRWHERGSVSEHRHTVATDAVLYPALRCFTGAVLDALATRDQGEGTVVTPHLASPDDEALFTPVVEQRRVTALGDTEVAGQPARALQWLGGNYGPDSRFVVARDTGALLSYRYASADGAAWTVFADRDHGD